MSTCYGAQTSALLEHEGVYWKDTNMQDAGYTYEYFNPQILDQENITAENGEVDPDGVSYQALIVWQEEFPAETAQKLLEYVQQGVKVLIVDGAAQHTPWNDGKDEELAAAMDELRKSENVKTIDPRVRPNGTYLSGCVSAGNSQSPARVRRQSRLPATASAECR